MRIVTRVSPRFDLCYALADIVSPEPTVPGDWLNLVGSEPEWLVAARRLGWGFWLGVPDVLEEAAPVASVAAFIDAVAGVPSDLFLRRMRRALFHVDSGEPVRANKRDWLHYIGIDVDAGVDPTVADPHGAMPDGGAETLHAAVVHVLRQMQPPFDRLWHWLAPQLQQSAERVDRLAQACTPGELAHHLLLKAEFDGAEHRIRALRGGYSLAFDDVAILYLMPSLFNTRRFWSAADESMPATLFFPYFDAAIGIPAAGEWSGAAVAATEFDPWLACRALGDPTRAAIVRILARQAQTASSLRGALRLSKATISHHIYQLREASLVDEEKRGRSIQLSLRPGAIAQLTPALQRELAGAADGLSRGGPAPAR